MEVIIITSYFNNDIYELDFVWFTHAILTLHFLIVFIWNFEANICIHSQLLQFEVQSSLSTFTICNFNDTMIYQRSFFGQIIKKIYIYIHYNSLIYLSNTLKSNYQYKIYFEIFIKIFWHFFLKELKWFRINRLIRN